MGKTAKNLLLIFIIGLIWGIFNVQNWSDFGNIGLTIGISIILWYIMWLGNQRVGYVLDRNISWVNRPVMRFIAGFIAHSSYSGAAIWVYGYVLYIFFNIDIGFRQTLFIAVGITLFIALFFYSLDFLNRYRKHYAKEKELENKLIKAQYNALKNQVNPHFLFNSLNTLNDLIYADLEIASNFIGEMSKVFRYVLDANKCDVIEDKYELEFLKSYLFLQKQRFGEGLQFHIYDPPSYRKIPPLSIYMLVENAIKHNAISLKTPLKINISLSGDKIEVTNNINLKDIPAGETNNLGLKNLEERYTFLGINGFEVLNSNQLFTVKIPLL